MDSPLSYASTASCTRSRRSSLAAGVPLVVAGGDIDKPAIAAWVARAGAGINLRTGRPKQESVAAAVGEILADPAYAQRARQIGTELATLGGAQKSVELLEHLVKTAEPVRRQATNGSSSRNGAVQPPSDRVTTLLPPRVLRGVAVCRAHETA